MVDDQFGPFKYEAKMESVNSPQLVPQEEVYLRLVANKITLEDNR